MSSKTGNTLIIPGPGGWEIWQGSSEQGFHRSVENGSMLASELEKIPSGQLLMGFPVREALAVPFKVQTDDESMFDDLAEMHLEKIGVRPEIGAGRLTDVFPISKEEGETSLLNVVLAAPEEGSMPPRAPKQFDISARFFTLKENAVTLWQELGRWVFAVSSGNRLAYFQSLPSSELSAEVARDVRLALTQLSLQGMGLGIDNVIVWTSGHSSDPSDEAIHALGENLETEVIAEPKPAPLLPGQLSKLVPADVRTEQRLKAARQKQNLMIAAVLLIYLGLVGYLGYDYWQLDKKLSQQENQLNQIQAEHGDIGFFNDDWDQLVTVVDDNHWPLNSLYRSASLIATNQVQNIRFKEFEATRTRILIRGEATDIKLATSYGEKLKRSLPDYDWTPPSEDIDPKTNRWKFTCEGILKGSQTDQ